MLHECDSRASNESRGVDSLAEWRVPIQLSSSASFCCSALTLCIRSTSGTCGDLLQWVMDGRDSQRPRHVERPCYGLLRIIVLVAVRAARVRAPRPGQL